MFSLCVRGASLPLPHAQQSTDRHILLPPRAAAAYYRGAMGILLVYDVTDEASFNNIRNWMKNIEQHASDNVVKVGVQAGAALTYKGDCPNCCKFWLCRWLLLGAC